MRDFKDMAENRYKCPLCGTFHDMEDSYVEKVVTNFEQTKATVRIRHIERTFIEQYYNVRICTRCFKKRVLVDNVLSWVILAITPLIAVFNIVISDSKNKGVEIAAVIVLGLPVLLLLKNIIKNLLYKKIDIDKAYEGNAIVR